jgi:hypothetical protein
MSADMRAQTIRQEARKAARGADRAVARALGLTMSVYKGIVLKKSAP